MTPHLRKFALAMHITFSVGSIGAVAGFVALAVTGLTSQDAQMIRAAYLAMKVTTWSIIIPLAFLSLLSGAVSSVGTSWGLFRYYWVLVKLLLTIFATIALLVHTRPIDLLAAAAAGANAFSAKLQGQQLHMLTASAAALALLIVLTVLSLYKPQGVISYGWCKQYEAPATPQP